MDSAPLYLWTISWTSTLSPSVILTFLFCYYRSSFSESDSALWIEDLNTWEWWRRRHPPPPLAVIRIPTRQIYGHPPQVGPSPINRYFTPAICFVANVINLVAEAGKRRYSQSFSTNKSPRHCARAPARQPDECRCQHSVGDAFKNTCSQVISKNRRAANSVLFFSMFCI